MADHYDAEDVTISGNNGDVVIEKAEDVHIQPDAVRGNLVIKQAQDVVVEDAVTVEVADGEDVVVESGANADTVTVENAQDVTEQ
jgi:hypothetical protein